MKRFVAYVVGALVVSAPLSAARADAARLVVVELFTSQGCSSCPPADVFLGELSGRRNILALSFHVDYWDYIGWRDPFGSPEATGRQRAYARALGNRNVYTPQMVVNGSEDVVGSRTGEAEDLIARAARTQAAVDVDLARVARRLMRVRLGASPTVQRAEVWLVEFDRSHSVDIPRGENAGRTLTYNHVVRRLERLPDYGGQGSESDVALSPAGPVRYGAAVIVQESGHGPIVGAGVSIEPEGRSAVPD